MDGLVFGMGLFLGWAFTCKVYTHRITIKFQPTGKSRLILNSISSLDYVTKESREIFRIAITSVYMQKMGTTKKIIPSKKNMYTISIHVYINRTNNYKVSASNKEYQKIIHWAQWLIVIFLKSLAWSDQLLLLRQWPCLICSRLTMRLLTCAVSSEFINSWHF